MSTGTGFVRFCLRSLNKMGRAGRNCVFGRRVHKGAIAGSVGVVMPGLVTVCVKGRMPSVAGDLRVGCPRLISFACLVTAAAAAKEYGGCEDEQGENAA